MIHDYLKAGYPALCVLTQEPHRAEQSLPCEGWSFFTWDCLQGIRDVQTQKSIDEVKDPVEAINWLNGLRPKSQSLFSIPLQGPKRMN